MTEFKISQLLLDQQNPRFPPTSSQKESIQLLLADEPPKLLNLAEDIAKLGLSPLDVICVVYEGRQPVVVEGNRRVAALKLLRRPSLAGHKVIAAELTKIGANGKGPDKIDCYVAASREDARHWIELRHAGEMDGVATKRWSSEQTNRFRRIRNSQADKASRFSDAVLREFPDDHALAADIAAARNARLTTIGRLVGDPDVARAFGFQFTDDDVLLDYQSSDLIQGFRKIFGDMRNGSVTDIKNKGHRQDYVLKSGSVLPDPNKRLANPRLPGSTTVAPPRGGAKGGGKGGKAGAPSKPEDVIFEKVKLAHFSQRTRDVLTASQRLRIDDVTPVCAVMLRVLIELVVTEVGATKGWFSDAEKLRKKIRTCLIKLDPDCALAAKRDKTLEAAWNGSQQDTGGGIAVDQMNSFIHNFMAHPSAADLRVLSLNFRPLLERLDAYLAVKP
jgi:hypothetical protein